jgi:peroxiredoxin
MFLRRFALLGLLVGSSLCGRADFAADFAALDAIQAERTVRAKAAEKFTPSQTSRWISDYSTRLAETAVAVYERNPTEPRRWEAALLALKTLRGFVVEVKPGYDEAVAARDSARVQALLVRDETARAAWDAKMDALENALFAAPDVAPGVLAEAYGNAIYRISLRRGASATERWARAQPLLAAMQQRVTDAAQLTRAFELASRLAQAADPASWNELLQSASQSPIPAVSSWAIGKANVEAAKIQAVEMKFTALDGRVVDLAALRGKVVLIDFWATWCGPCKEELPNVKAAYEKYHAQGFEVVAISLDAEKDRQKLIDYVREKDLPWPQHFDGKGWKNEFSVKFGIRAIPAMFLLDQEGKVASTNARGAKLESEIRRLLKLDAPTAAPAAPAVVSATDAPPVALAPAGTLAPDFVSNDLTGQAVKISDYRGKVLILDFWATWCGPCIASMPHTQEVAARYADQGVAVLAVATGDKRKRFEDWVKLKAKDYPALRFTMDPHEQGTPQHDRRASWSLYGVPAIPTQFVIDRDGRIAGSVTGYYPGDNALEKALAAAGVKVDPAILAKPSRSELVRASTLAPAPTAASQVVGPTSPAVARRQAPPFTEKVAKLAAGDRVADIEFRATDGSPRKLSDYRGRPVVLFFGTAEMIPADYLDSIVALYGASSVHVLALVTRDTETSFAAWRTLHAERGHKFAVAFDPAPASEPRNGAIFQIFQFGAPTPFSIVIDADGRFVGMFPWKLPQGQQGLAELLRRSGVAVPPQELPAR